MADYEKKGFSKGPGGSAADVHFGARVAEASKTMASYKTDGLEGAPAETLVEIASMMGEYLKILDLKTTQIRRFLDGARKIDAQSNRGKSFNADSVILLKPKLAYAVGRDPKKTKPLMEVLDPAISAGAKSYKSFKKLLSLIEGIVAYHRYHGGKD